MFYSASTLGFYVPEVHGDSMPEDAIEITAEEHAAILEAQATGKILSSDEDGRPVLLDKPLPTTAELVVQYTAALEAHFDARAKERRYDSRITCSLRAGYPGPFQAEGTAFAVWMDTCNALGYSIMEDVLGGERPMPTIAELIAEMPVLVWPA
jgi:hypothetical protein